MKNTYMTLILQNLVLFPNQEVKLELNNDNSKYIVELSKNKSDADIVILYPKDTLEIRPNIKDLSKTGTLAKIKTTISLPNGNVRVTLRGIKRVSIKSISIKEEEKYIEVVTAPIENPPYNLDQELSYVRKIKELVKKYVESSSKNSNSILGIIKNVTSLSKLCDMIGATFEFPYEQKRMLLEETNYYARAKSLLTALASELMSLELENKIDEEIRSNFEKSEKKIIIKEKISLLKQELGEELENSVCDKYRGIIKKLNVSKDTKDSMLREVSRFQKTLENSPEYSVLEAHLEFVTSLPWNKSTTEVRDIDKIDKSLNASHYGLNKAKERILEYLILKDKNTKVKSPILCLVGPPGTGKTTFAKELANSIGRKFFKISVGGLNDSSELIGHRRTYIGAGPGKIMEGIRKCGVNNPIILIDEIDKMVKDYKGDPASVLLAILDQNQNREFVDNYVSEPFDLSHVIFILTANEEKSIPPALLDRLETIEVNSYTLFDKLEIAKNYTLPRLGKEYGFDYTKIDITKGALTKIAMEYTKEAGMRDMERKISSIVRKVLIKSLDKKVTISEKDIPLFIGNEKYVSYSNKYFTSGTVNVPACTPIGGSVLNVECAIYQGKEEIVATGSLGEVMKESASVSIGYIKSNAKELKIDVKKLSGMTVHIHALDGASKKDGPSAGLAITTAIVSKLLDVKVPEDTAFTGEISLAGRILKIGGLKEKLISAYNSKIKKVYIPAQNLSDLETIPKEVLKSVNIMPVNSFTEVYNDIFN